MDRLVKNGIATWEYRPVDSRIAASLLLAMSTLPPLQPALQPQALLSAGWIADEITEVLRYGICR